MAALEVIISEGQSLLDVCIQEAGTLDSVFLLCQTNGLSISDPLRAGQRLSLAGIEPNEVASYFKSRNIRINTHTKVAASETDDIILIDGDESPIVDFDGAYIAVE